MAGVRSASANVSILIQHKSRKGGSDDNRVQAGEKDGH